MTTFRQINLTSGRVIPNLCTQMAANYQADILLLSEQSRRLDTAECYEDTSGRAEIMVLNPVIRASCLKSAGAVVLSR